MSNNERFGDQAGFFDDESGYEDLDAAIMEAGGYKVVGAQLFETLTAQKAAERLHHCLDPDKRDKLSWPQIKDIFRMARARGGATGINHMLTECGYRQTVAESDEAIARQVALDMRQLQSEHEQRMTRLLKRAGLLGKGER